MAKQGKSSKNNTAELAQQQQQPGAARPPQDLKFLTTYDFFQFKFVRSILILAVVFHLFWALTNFFTMGFALSSAIRQLLVVLSELTFFIKPLLLFAVNTNFQNALRTMGVPTTDVEDVVDRYQVGFSKVEDEEEEEKGAHS